MLRAELRRLMYEKVGLQRDAHALQQGIAQFAEMALRVDALEREPGDPASHADIVQWAELRNLILVARLIAHAALRRQESRGAHYRVDFPDTSPHWLQRQAISIADLIAPKQDVA
jgi:aspartate oxidase